jgi:hypothetical protein
MDTYFYRYGGIVTEMRPGGSCFIEYYDGDTGWINLGTEQTQFSFAIVYPVGTQVYKNFPTRTFQATMDSFYWGETTTSRHDADGLYCEVLAKIADELDSAQLLEELCAAKRKRNSNIAVADEARKRKTHHTWV